MSRIRNLKLLYALMGLLWMTYSSGKLLAVHVREHTPFSIGTFYCLLLFASVPAFGYILLFKLFPLAGRLRRR